MSPAHSTPGPVIVDAHSRRDPDLAGWWAPTRGTRLPPEAASVADRCRALGLVVSPHALVTGPTSATLRDLPLPAYASPLLEVSVRDDVAQVQRSGVRCRRRMWLDLDADEVAGIRTTSAARTFVDLAAVLALRDLVAVGDAILRRRLASRHDIADVIRRSAGQRGVKRARQAADLLDPAAASPQESRLRVVLWEDGLSGFCVNHPITDDAGQFLAVGDLVDVERRIVTEYDGDTHRTREGQARDAARRHVLTVHDWLLVTCVADDIRFPERARRKVRDARAVRDRHRQLGAA